MVLQVPSDPEGRLTKGNGNTRRDHRVLRDGGSNDEGCKEHSLPEYFLHGNGTNILRGSGPLGLNTTDRTNGVNQGMVSTGPGRTVSTLPERALLLENTGKELRKVADMFIITRNTGHELRRIADEVYFKFCGSETHPPDVILFEDMAGSNLRRRKS
ncbi:uncharacterized protein LOC121415191 [Lytechinus variegatus]|uniref:uncharacterized protein LOC121415191 n=1 Tax=Lytechinus variegatus TaxID=7654 RepID=UPI001BB193BD|nr:uncharacterized protein LOC121415191 [Lytechinus variegatus]XP_041464289.1 uncharacterized protein LOC121415191 [Lytechinus variegatus]